MGIEARGGKYPYVGIMRAKNYQYEFPNMVIPHVTSASMFLVADSDEEAEGKIARKAKIVLPTSEGWRDHDSFIFPLANVDWIEDTKDEDLKVIKRPYGKNS